MGSTRDHRSLVLNHTYTNEYLETDLAVVGTWATSIGSLKFPGRK